MANLSDFLQAKKPERHFKAVFYSAAGVGKTYLAAHSDSAVFLRTEDRHRYLPKECAMLPLVTSFKGKGKEQRDIASLVEQLHLIETTEHDYKTLVVDGLSGIADVFKDHVLSTNLKGDGNKAKSLEDFGYNLGYSYVIQLWSWFLSTLDRIAEKRSMNIILLAHAVVKTYKSPIAGEDYDIWSMNLFDQKNLSAEKSVMQWADFVFFMKMETVTVDVTTGIGKTRKTVTKATDINTAVTRCLFTESRSAFQAKNSSPETLEFMYELTNGADCAAIFQKMK
jgi:hypothetical protein